MQSILKYIVLFILTLSIFSCEEVIEVDLDEAPPRLVIEASIIWLKDTPGTYQEIIISRTTPFYAEETEPVVDATIIIYSEDNQIFEFQHRTNGRYINENFQPVLGQQYSMELKYNDEIYTASETFQPVVGIDYIEQSNSGGFAGDEIELKAYYTDPAATKDYYLFKFLDDGEFMLEFYEDEFTNGNQIFGYYSAEDIELGDTISIEMEGISESYYEYLFILRSQVGTNQGGPFETMPATVKGNIINQTNPDNYPFGYFRLSEADAVNYKVE